MSEDRAEGTSEPRAGNGEVPIVWDDSQMTTTFANVVNIQSTREQVDLFFGTNKTWNIANDGQVKVELTNRMILAPYAAVRLYKALGNVLREYEQRHGKLGE